MASAWRRRLLPAGPRRCPTGRSPGGAHRRARGRPSPSAWGPGREAPGPPPRFRAGRGGGSRVLCSWVRSPRRTGKRLLTTHEKIYPAIGRPALVREEEARSDHAGDGADEVSPSALMLLLEPVPRADPRRFRGQSPQGVVRGDALRGVLFHGAVAHGEGFDRLDRRVQPGRAARVALHGREDAGPQGEELRRLLVRPWVLEPIALRQLLGAGAAGGVDRWPRCASRGRCTRRSGSRPARRSPGPAWAPYRPGASLQRGLQARRFARRARRGRRAPAPGRAEPQHHGLGQRLLDPRRASRGPSAAPARGPRGARRRAAAKAYSSIA